MIIKLTPKPWEVVFYTAPHAQSKKYVLHLVALSDDEGNYPRFPVSIIEKGAAGAEVYIATYANMDKQHFTSLADMAFCHNSALNSFESLEDLN